MKKQKDVVIKEKVCDRETAPVKHFESHVAGNTLARKTSPEPSIYRGGFGTQNHQIRESSENRVDVHHV